MKQLIYLGFIVFIFLSCGIKEEKQTGVFPYKIHQRTLANGLRVIAIPFDSPGLVTYTTAVRVGSRNEIEKGVTGFAHFFEHLMFYGTKTYNKDAAAKLKKSMAAGGNAYTSNDQTIYYLTGSSDKLNQFFELQSDNFKNLHFDEAAFKREAGAVLGEYTKNFSSWYRQLDSKARELGFKNHTYAHSTMGYETDIKDMPNQYEYAWTFFKRFYRPEYCALVIVGDIDPQNVFTLAENYYGDWEKGDYLADIPKESPQVTEESGHISRGDVLPAFFMGYKTPGYMENMKESIVLEIIGTLLSSEKSDLFQRLINKEQKAKSLWAWGSNNRDPHYFTVVSRVDRESPEDLAYVKAEIEKEIEKIKTLPQNKAYLDAIKSHRKYSFLGGLNNPQSIALQMAEQFQLTGDPATINQYFTLLESVSPEDIMTVAKKYLVQNSRTVVSMTKDEKGMF